MQCNVALQTFALIKSVQTLKTSTQEPDVNVLHSSIFKAVIAWFRCVLFSSPSVHESAKKILAEGLTQKFKLTVKTVISKLSDSYYIYKKLNSPFSRPSDTISRDEIYNFKIFQQIHLKTALRLSELNSKNISYKKCFWQEMFFYSNKTLL